MLFKFDGKYPEIGQGTFVSEEALVIGNVKIGDNRHVATLRGDYGSILIGPGKQLYIDLAKNIWPTPWRNCRI